MRRALGGAVLALGGPMAHAAQASPSPARAEKPLIMLDPGHGGHDPGAIALDGYYEKYIALDAGLELRRMLEYTGRYRVAMTRSRDVFVPLDHRVADAMHHKADLFLSLHCDHLPENDLRGASIFTLSNNATDKLAAALAQDENGDDADSRQVASAPPQVADILASLETRATKVSSHNLAQDLAASFNGVVPMLPNPTRAANFAVLRDPSTPAALLEMGCLTNKRDEARLRNTAEREKLMRRVTVAINSYFDHAAQRRMAG